MSSRPSGPPLSLPSGSGDSGTAMAASWSWMLSALVFFFSGLLPPFPPRQGFSE